MTPIVVAEHMPAQQVVDTVELAHATLLAVVDASGRVVGAVETAEHPALFGCPQARVSGTPRQRRRRERYATATARDLMEPAVAVPAGWPERRVRQALAAAGSPVAFMVDPLGRVTGVFREDPAG